MHFALQVWEEGVRSQIASVEPYQPYKRAEDLRHEMLNLERDPFLIPWLSLLPVAVSLFLDSSHRGPQE